MRRDAGPLALLTLLALPVIFWDLGRYSPINMDELFYHGVARHMLETGEWWRLEYFGEHRLYDTFLNAPLFYWIKALAIAALGDGWWAMRLPSALMGVFSLWATYALVRHIESRAAGLLAGLVQLTTFQFVYLHSARTGEIETAVCLALTLSALLFLRAVEEDRGFWGHHLCIVALAHLKLPLAGIPILAEILWFAVDADARRRLRDWLVTGLWLLPLALAWRVGQALADWDGFLDVLSQMRDQASGEEKKVASRHGGPLGNALYYARSLVFGGFPHTLVAPLALAGMGWRAWRDRSRGWRLVAFQLVALAAFLLFVSKHFPWYVVPAYPFLSAFAGGWLDRVRREGLLPAELAGLAVCLAALPWLSLPLFSFDPFTSRPAGLPEFGWRSGAALQVPLLAGGLALGVFAARRHLTGRAAALALCAALLGFGAVRVIAPLRFTGYESASERLRKEIDAARRQGLPLPYPIEYHKDDGEIGLIRIRYYFHEDFWIVPDRKPGTRTQRVLLYDRARGEPPHAAGPPS